MKPEKIIKIVPPLLLISTLLCGCGLYIVDSGRDFYYLNPEKSPSETGRVIMVELQNKTDYPSISSQVSSVLYRALQKKQLFGISLIPQTHPKWKNLQLNLDKSYNAEELLKIQEELACDAIMIGTITHYQPFPHMSIGMRLKLIDLTDGGLIWAAEQIWDSSDKTTRHRMKKYFQEAKRLGITDKTLREKLSSVSTMEFLNFVSYETASTFDKQK